MTDTHAKSSNRQSDTKPKRRKASSALPKSGTVRRGPEFLRKIEESKLRADTTKAGQWGEPEYTRNSALSQIDFANILPDQARRITVLAEAKVGNRYSTGRIRKLIKTGTQRTRAISYTTKSGVEGFVYEVIRAEPIAIIELERQGVKGSYIKALSRRLRMPTSRFYKILGLPKATAERKASSGGLVSGSSGHTAIAMTKLLGLASEIVADSTSDEARSFDIAGWLGKWIEQPQPSLGGQKPSDLIDTPTGAEVVARLLGAIESGSYQ